MPCPGVVVVVVVVLFTVRSVLLLLGPLMPLYVIHELPNNKTK
jgi:hypothetical protein